MSKPAMFGTCFVLLLASLTTSVTVDARAPLLPNPPSPPKSPKSPVVRYPNPPKPPSPPFGAPPASICTSNTLNQIFNDVKSQINTNLANQSDASTTTTNKDYKWDTEGPMDFCTWKGAKITTTTISGMKSLQITTLNTSSTSCNNTAGNQASISGKMMSGYTFTQPLKFTARIQWQGTWCPEMGIPTNTNTLIDLSGSITGLSGSSTTSFTATANNTGSNYTTCITSLHADSVSMTYKSASASVSLALIGTVDITSKFQDGLNNLVRQVSNQITQAINNAKVPKCNTFTLSS